MPGQDSPRALLRATRIAGLDERYADIKGVRLRYFISDGSGAPLVLLHGLGGAACNWTAVIESLSAACPLLVPELPGHGGSSPLPACPTLDPIADRLLLLAQREGLGPAVFAGHSLGALIALRVARRSPSGALGVVLAGAAGISSASIRAKKALAITSFVQPGRHLAPHREAIARRPALRRAILFWGSPDTDALEPGAAERFLIGPALHRDTASAAKALVADDVREHLGGVRCPCLVLWGARDSQVGIADAIDYARRLRAPLRTIADCGHLLIGERPDVCAAALESFAASVSP
jgi:pimeloyl-ACP methyl ester carboxylesterase